MADVSVLALLLRLVVSLAVVLGLMAVAAKLLARTAGGARVARSARPVPIEVLARHSLGKNSSVAVVHAAGKALIVGVTDAQVTLLGETDADALTTPLAEDPATTITASARTRPPWASPTRPGGAAFSPWTAIVEQLRERTVRRS